MRFPIDAPLQAFMVGERVLVVPEPQFPGDGWPERIGGWQRLCILGPGPHCVEVIGAIELPARAAIWIPNPKSDELPYITGHPFIPPQT